MPGKKVTAAFASMKSDLGAARPNTGGGRLGKWPAEGIHQCFVQGIETDEDAKLFVGRTNEGKILELDAVEYRFRFQLVEDPDSPDSPMEWGGAPFTFPLNMGELKDQGKRQQVEIARDRFCGHLTMLVGKEVGTEGGLDEEDALEKAKALLNGDTHVIAEVECEYRQGKPRRGAAPDAKPPVYRTEFIRSLVTS
jgi:hypothetical protein